MSLHWMRACIMLAALVLGMNLLLTGEPSQITQPPPRLPRPMTPPEDNPMPDANDLMKMREAKAKQQNFTAVNIERRKQIAEDSTRLLKLASDLSAEADKKGKDGLSLDVIRRIDEIERLAHDVKEKMKLSIGAN